MIKLNLGAGSDILNGYINHDICTLPGIDIVHNLNVYPWPFDDSSCSEVKIYDVLEHLDDFMRAMEELHRILMPGGIIKLQVPYYLSWSAYADPTHKKYFHELTFRFFDPLSCWCQERPYYSHARFFIIEEFFILYPFSPYFSFPFFANIFISNIFAKRLLSTLSASSMLNLINDLRFTLQKPF